MATDTEPNWTDEGDEPGEVDFSELAGAAECCRGEIRLWLERWAQLMKVTEERGNYRATHVAAGVQDLDKLAAELQAAADTVKKLAGEIWARMPREK